MYMCPVYKRQSFRRLWMQICGLGWNQVQFRIKCQFSSFYSSFWVFFYCESSSSYKVLLSHGTSNKQKRLSIGSKNNTRQVPNASKNWLRRVNTTKFLASWLVTFWRIAKEWMIYIIRTIVWPFSGVSNDHELIQTVCKLCCKFRECF